MNQCCTCGPDLPADSGPLCATGWQGRATWLAHSCLSGVITFVASSADWPGEPVQSHAFLCLRSISQPLLRDPGKQTAPGEQPLPGQKEWGERGRRALLLQTSRPGRIPPNTSQGNEGQRRPWGVGTGWNQETLGSGADSLWAFEHVS